MEIAKNIRHEYKATIVALVVALVVTWIALVFSLIALARVEPVVYVQPSAESCVGYK